MSLSLWHESCPPWSWPILNVGQRNEWPSKFQVGLTDKVALLPETSYGGCRVTLILKNGRKVSEVSIAWGIEIVQIDGVAIADEAQLGFSPDDIVDVVPWP